MGRRRRQKTTSPSSSSDPGIQAPSPSPEGASSPSSSSRMGAPPAPPGRRSLDRSWREIFSRLLRRHTELLVEREGWVLGPKPWGSSSPLPAGLHPLPSVFAAGGPWGSGPRLWAASFWVRSCKRGMGCWEGGRTGRPSWVPHTAVLGGEPGAFVDSSAQHPGSPVSRQYSWRPQLPGLPAHPPPPRSLSARAVRRVFTPEPAPKPRLSPQQTSSAAGLPGRTQASAVPSAPRDPASPADPWGPGPLTCSCLAFKALWGLPLSPAPTPGSSPSLLSAAPSTRACPAPPVHQAGNTTFSLNVAAAKL